MVEVAVTSQSRDRRKATYYGEAGVPVSFLVDVVARTITRYQQPSAAGYENMASVDAIDVEVAGEPVPPITAAMLFDALPPTA